MSRSMLDLISCSYLVFAQEVVCGGKGLVLFNIGGV
jgi:hypothetical protein